MDPKVKATITAFLSAWIKKEWEKMLKACQLTWAYTKTQEDLEEVFGSAEYRIKSFEIKGFTNASNVKQVVHLELSFSNGAVEQHQAILICEKEPYKPAAYGSWGVNPASVLRNFGTIKPRRNEGKK